MRLFSLAPASARKLVTGAALGSFWLTACAAPGPSAGQKPPEFIGHEWRNTSKALSIASLKGKVVLVHFWTLGCINCKHNLPSYNAWEKQFMSQGLQIIGIHTPETPYERSSSHVDAAIAQRGITYPVLIDRDSKNWNAWNQQFWPAIYLIDKSGRIRDSWQGELDYNNAGGTAKLTGEIRSLLAEQS